MSNEIGPGESRVQGPTAGRPPAPTEKRYQVFISSTYADLKEERRAVIQAVIELNCIPAGMELFPAADEEQFAFIKRVIDDCDYYLLIIAGRYGSIGADGVSYTEKEFDYAVSRGLPIVALIHEDPEQIAFGKSEKDPALRDKLDKFKAKVRTGRLVKFWKNPQELSAFIFQSLSSTMYQFPAIGWVRANKVASEEILTEINDLRKHNAELEAALADIKPTPAIPDLAGLDEEIKIPFMFPGSSYAASGSFEVTVSWREIFYHICPYLSTSPSDDIVKGILQQALSKKRGYGSQSTMDDQTFRTVALQLQVVGLVNVKPAKNTAGWTSLFWSLTGAGERLMLEIRTVRTTAK
jgi:uncharacterized protein DUF4062